MRIFVGCVRAYTLYSISVVSASACCTAVLSSKLLGLSAEAPPPPEKQAGMRKYFIVHELWKDTFEMQLHKIASEKDLQIPSKANIRLIANELILFKLKP